MDKKISVKNIIHLTATLVAVFTFGFCSHLIYADTDMDTNMDIIRYFSNATEDGWKYIKLYDTDKDCELIAITEHEGEQQDNLVIPGSIDGVDVRVLKGHIFGYGDDCSSITVPWEVEEIRGNIFESLNTEEIVFESDSRLKKIDGRFAFGLTNITRIELPDSVEYIGDEAFSHAFDLRELHIGPNVKEIGDGCFFQTKLSDVVIDEGNEWYELNDEMLIEKRTNKLLAYSYDKVEKENGKVFIPDYIEEIDPYALPKNAKCIEVDEKNNYYASYNGCLYSKDGKTLYRVPEKMEPEDFEFNDKVDVIERYAFKYCMYDEPITIPETVKDIEMFAFDSQDLCISKSLQFADLQTFTGKIHFQGDEKDWEKINIVNAMPEITLTYDLIFMEE